MTVTIGAHGCTSSGVFGLRFVDEHLLGIERFSEIELDAGFEGERLGHVGIDRGVDVDARGGAVARELEEQVALADAQPFGQRPNGDWQFNRQFSLPWLGGSADAFLVAQLGEAILEAPGRCSSSVS